MPKIYKLNFPYNLMDCRCLELLALLSLKVEKEKEGHETCELVFVIL